MYYINRNLINVAVIAFFRCHCHKKKVKQIQFHTEPKEKQTKWQKKIYPEQDCNNKAAQFDEKTTNKHLFSDVILNTLCFVLYGYLMVSIGENIYTAAWK